MKVERAGARQVCALCGGPLRADSVYGICSRTKTCEAERHRRAEARRAAAQRGEPARRYQWYTADDDARIAAGIGAGQSLRRIAADLDRDYKSVCYRAGVLGLGRRRHRQPRRVPVDRVRDAAEHYARSVVELELATSPECERRALRRWAAAERLLMRVALRQDPAIANGDPLAAAAIEYARATHDNLTKKAKWYSPYAPDRPRWQAAHDALVAAWQATTDWRPGCERRAGNREKAGRGATR